jgi:ABC-type multidrug transport system ATPase subunit
MADAHATAHSQFVAMTLIQAQGLTHGPIHKLNCSWPAGVSWICGDEGTGKTTLLRLLAGDVQPTAGNVLVPEGGVFWLDLQGAQHDDITVQNCWDDLRCTCPNWQENVFQALTDDLAMRAHLHKRLHMLSRGSRRKVMLIAALASGAAVTLLDQPFVSLDAVSIRILQDFLQDAADHPARAWLVADYAAPAHMAAQRVLHLA